MEGINNIYRGQYRAEKGLGGSFSQYWSKNGVESKGDAIRIFMEGLFDLLDRDLAISVGDSDYNQPIFDRVEFRDLCKVLKQILQEYQSASASDTKTVTDVTTERLKAAIAESVQECMRTIGKQSQSAESTVKNELSKLFADFVEKTKSAKGKGTSKRSPSKKEDALAALSDIEKIGAALQRDKVDGEYRGERLFGEMRKSREFGEFVNKVAARAATVAEEMSSRVQIASSVVIDKQQQVIKKLQDTLGGSVVNASSQGKDASARRGNGMKDLEKLADEISKQDEKSSKSFFKKFGTVLKNIKIKQSMLVKTTLWLFKPVLNGIRSSLGKVLNAMKHPIKTIMELFSQNWLRSLFKIAFNNPANAYFFGYLVGLFWQKCIKTPLYRFIINPILGFRNLLHRKFVVESLEKQLQDMSGGGRDTLGDMLKNLGKFFVYESGLNPLFGFLKAIADIVGLKDKSFNDVLTATNNLAQFIFTGMFNIMKHGLLSHFQGAGLLQKVVMLSLAQQGRGMAEILQPSDRDYEFKVLDKLREGLPEEYEIQEEYGTDYEGAEQALQDYVRVKSEYEYVVQLRDVLNELRDEGDAGALSIGEIEHFLQSTYHDQADMMKALDKLSKQYGGEKASFETLSREKQLQVLSDLIGLRRGGAQAHLEMFQSSAKAAQELYGILKSRGTMETEEEVYVGQTLQTSHSGPSGTHVLSTRIVSQQEIDELKRSGDMVGVPQKMPLSEALYQTKGGRVKETTTVSSAYSHTSQSTVIPFKNGEITDIYYGQKPGTGQQQQLKNLAHDAIMQSPMFFNPEPSDELDEAMDGVREMIQQDEKLKSIRRENESGGEQLSALDLADEMADCALSAANMINVNNWFIGNRRNDIGQCCFEGGG